MAHLRAVKDPLLAARAAELLPSESRVRVVHCGQALEDDLREEAERTARRTDRYRWLGLQSRTATQRVIASSRLLVVTSRFEGGPNVISEAVVNHVPVLATRIEGVVGLLGADYPGLFEPGDARALAALLDRAERDTAFLGELTRACRALLPLFDPAREREAWREILADVSV